MPRRATLDAIVEELMRPPKERRTVKAATVRRWMRAKNPEARGATFSFLTEVGYTRKVYPFLRTDEVFDWFLRYYAWCLKTDPQGEWLDGRWGAAREMIVWFIWMWDEEWERSYLERVKALLAKLYISGSRDLKGAIEVGLLEHLFERRKIKRFFESWKDDPQLGPAYEAASPWALEGYRIPWTRRRRRKREPAT
jgi:hypothetical protein